MLISSHTDPVVVEHQLSYFKAEGDDFRIICVSLCWTAEGSHELKCFSINRQSLQWLNLER